MALQSSGAISLDDIHDEAGGTSGSTCTINDSDIRDLIDKSDGASMAFNEWYGASAFTPVDYSIIAFGSWPGNLGSIDWCDILTIGGNADSTTFGNLTARSILFSGSCASTTRSIFMLGND